MNPRVVMVKQCKRRKQSPKYLPDEITINILTKLPVTSLLRFKIVSKQWNSWISNPESDLSKQRRSAGAILIGGRSFSLINQQLNVQNIENPLRERHVSSIRLLGFCDGILLISADKDIYLWNPATRFCTKVIELDLLTSDEHVISAGGLCFDSSKNEYKVLLYIYNKSPWDSDGAYPLVASLKDKQWRRLNISYDEFSARDGIAMHGRLHSRANLSGWDNYFQKYDEFYRKRGSLNGSDDEDEDAEMKWETYRRLGPRNEVIYFDPISEKFHSLYKRKNAIVGLGVLNDCFCVTCEGFDTSLEILVMTEYGRDDSWTSLFVIRNSEITRPDRFDQCLFTTYDGELALVGHQDCNYDKVVAYNPRNDSTEEFLHFGLPATTYVESLISLKEYYWSKKQHKKNLYKFF